MKKNKYGAKKAFALGRTFDSQGERDRALVLMEAIDQGLIRNIAFQTQYSLSVNGVHICKYRSDFVYEKKIVSKQKAHLGNILKDDCVWIEVVEDYKGFETPVFKLKNKLMKACLDIEVKIVKTPTANI